MDVQGYLFSRPQPGGKVAQVCRALAAAELEPQR